MISKLPKSTAQLFCRPSHISFLLNRVLPTSPDGPEALLLKIGNKKIVWHSPFVDLGTASSLVTLPHLHPQKLASELGVYLKESKIERLEIDQSLPYRFYNEIQNAFNADSISILNELPFWQDRMIKSEDEIAKIKKAAAITANTMRLVKKKLTKGVTELELAHQISLWILKSGADGNAFDPIVAFGANSAKPHHEPSSRQLLQDEVVLIDIGAKYQGYHADMTRTWWIGKNPSNHFTETKRRVMAATNQAEAKLEIGSLVADIDLAVRAVFINAGCEDKFIHTSGHGLGLDIHEFPSIHQSVKVALSKNMTLAIEPGLYYPGEFGFRHENTWLITDQKPVLLTA